MKLPGRREPQHGGSTNQPAGRMTKRQELILFVLMILVLIAIIAWGLRA